MRERGKKKEGQRNVIPPQIFNGQEFRGVRCGHCYLLWPASTFFQGLRRLWYRQWRWCPWRVPRSGKVKTKGTAIKIIKIYAKRLYIRVNNESLDHFRSHRSKREQLLPRWTSWKLASSRSRRRQSQAKKKMRYLMRLSYSFSVFLHICPFSSFIFSLFVTLFLAPYLCFWWRTDKPSRGTGNNCSLQSTCFSSGSICPANCFANLLFCLCCPQLLSSSFR